MLKNPIALGLIAMLMVGLQIAASYMSVISFFEDDIVLGLSFFLFVPILGLILALYIIRFRKQKTPNPPNKQTPL